MEDSSISEYLAGNLIENVASFQSGGLPRKIRPNVNRSRWRISAPRVIESTVSLLDPTRSSASEVAGLGSPAHRPGRHGAKLASRPGLGPKDFERLLKNTEPGDSRIPARKVESLPFENDALGQSLSSSNARRGYAILSAFGARSKAADGDVRFQRNWGYRISIYFERNRSLEQPNRNNKAKTVFEFGDDSFNFAQGTSFDPHTLADLQKWPWDNRHSGANNPLQCRDFTVLHRNRGVA